MYTSQIINKKNVRNIFLSPILHIKNNVTKIKYLFSIKASKLFFFYQNVICIYRQLQKFEKKI